MAIGQLSDSGDSYTEYLQRLNGDIPFAIKNIKFHFAHKKALHKITCLLLFIVFRNGQNVMMFSSYVQENLFEINISYCVQLLHIIAITTMSMDVFYNNNKKKQQ